MKLVRSSNSGFTLVETVVGAAIFLIIALGVYQGFFVAAKAVTLSKIKTEAALLANEQFELIHNLPYASVGIASGLPLGVLPRHQTFARSGVAFDTILSIRNVDDPFDGTIGGIPHDTAPADYKTVALSVSCENCPLNSPLDFVTTIAPKNVENSTNNGALFINVIDAGGAPVAGASVHVENDQAFPPVSFDETTGNNGQLQLVDVPTGVNTYQVTVTKSGYSSASTLLASVSNPNPIAPQPTVAVGQVTAATFSIDRASVLHISSVDASSTPVALNFSLTGSKLIGTEPDIIKYQEDFSTDSSGQKTIDNLEWDNYELRLTDSAYDLVEIAPSSTAALLPGEEQNISFIVTLHDQE